MLLFRFGSKYADKGVSVAKQVPARKPPTDVLLISQRVH